MKSLKILLIIIVILGNSCTSKGQKEKTFRLAFYNVENLFDTKDDPKTHDNEFLPNGKKRWNNKKYQEKLSHIYKTLMQVKGLKKLSIIGLAEIENRKVLNELLYKTPLYREKYKIIHQDSPDERGIDVALLYREEEFKVINHQFIRVFFEDDKRDKTRDILYAKGIIFDRDTLHVYVNHWPSRYGGYMKTKGKRERAATILAQHMDSIYHVNPNALCVAVGDFNDKPKDSSIKTLLKETKNVYLYNLLRDRKDGTVKYRSHWNLFDQILVSRNLTNKNHHIQVQNASIGKFPFLMEKDYRNGGNKPFRTYLGYKYNGGYSDHLPVYVDFFSIGNK